MKFRVLNIIILLFNIALYSQNNNAIELCRNNINYVVFTDIEGMIKPEGYSQVLKPTVEQLSTVLNSINGKVKTKNDAFQLLFYIDEQQNKKVWINHLIYLKKTKAKREFSGWKNNIIVGMGGFYEKFIKSEVIDLKEEP